MKKFLVFLPVLLLCLTSQSQEIARSKKYPSLFWEISGNGLKKPSYLFGTMHVSSKLAFHLSDSFYVAIRNVDVVALENNPESWQEDMNKYLTNTYSSSSSGGMLLNDLPKDYLNIHTLQIEKYESRLERALYMKPAVINNLLYRNNSENTSDFEEDTYLDLYIYQTGKRMGKRVAGVEQYAESMRLMNEAYKDAARDPNRKMKSFDPDDEYSPEKIQEAYRLGDLDLLDSINQINSQSAAFDEKFLYRRNEIQAASIDSILKKASLFVGIGAAHLPGERGVIELLRQKGYRLRPIFMGNRDSRFKEIFEKIRVPVNFRSQESDDRFFKVDIPGKFYRFENNGLDQQQYADMANGSFYMVTRVPTYSLFWGHSIEQVIRKLDSVLYDNVPGKLLSKKRITRNGYPGFDITSRTRRGDYQRYHIFITPYEVIFFRMGGNGDYVKSGTEAQKFFNSITIREFHDTVWKKFNPAYGGFSVDLPGDPYIRIDKKVQVLATDSITGSHYAIFRADIHNYSFIEEDSMDLQLLKESFASSEFIGQCLEEKRFVWKGYPALDCRFQHKNGSLFFVRFLIRGPHYYTIVAHTQSENPGIKMFFNSFEVKPFLYGAMTERKDTALAFTVKTTWFPENNQEKLDMSYEYAFEDEEEDSGFENPAGEIFKSRLLRNDSTGEAVFVSFYKVSKYYSAADTAELNDTIDQLLFDKEDDWIIRKKEIYLLPNQTQVRELTLSDTNSSRAILTKSYYRQGMWFQLMAETDTLTGPGSFVKTFFETFKPADTLQDIDPLAKKSTIFFDDFFSKDSIARIQAIRSIAFVSFDSSDLPMLQQAIHSLSWSEKKYLDNKIQFINKLGEVPGVASADLLKKIYFDAGDTIRLQQAALEALLKHRTRYAYQLFKEIITTEPPVLDLEGTNFSYSTLYTAPDSRMQDARNFYNGSFMDELYDSLPLTHSLLPELLTLINLDDYKWPVMRLLRVMADSNLLLPAELDAYVSKFFIEIKQGLKKQAIEEKKSAIQKAEEDKKTVKNYYYSNTETDKGNENLLVYARLLLPYRESRPGVESVFQQLLSSADKRLKYNTFYLLMRNNKPVPDSLFTYFASLDEYRFELYADLYRMNKLDKFPVPFTNRPELARSKLLFLYTYMRPDSLQLIDSLTATVQNKSGWVYFFRYKLKKDDAFWKLASAGFLPLAPDQLFFEDYGTGEDELDADQLQIRYLADNGIQSGFTQFTDTKIRNDEPIQAQLNRQLKKILITKRKSGQYFYVETGGSVHGWDD